MVKKIKLKKNTNFMAPFYGWGSTASRLEPLRGGSLLFTTKFRDLYLSKASGPDCIPGVVLKNCEADLSYIVAKLLSMCLK